VATFVELLYNHRKLQLYEIFAIRDPRGIVRSITFVSDPQRLA